MSKYVIRQFLWGYDDETFYPAGKELHSVYDDEQEANNALTRLEASHWRSQNLFETQAFFDPEDDDLMAKVDSFIEDKTGKPLFGDAEYGDAYLPAELSDEDIVQLAKMAELSAYQIFKFEDEVAYHAVWLTEEQRYITIADESTEALVAEPTLDALMQEVEDELGYAMKDHKMKGTLEELSDTPELLASFMETEPDLYYNEKSKILKYKGKNPDTARALNELLRDKPFEIRKLNLEQLRQIENSLY